jgi:triosephosphate isomerase
LYAIILPNKADDVTIVRTYNGRRNYFMRRKVVAGNWKMNMTPAEAVKLVNELKPLMSNTDAEVLFCVPSIDIIPVVEQVAGSNICVGAQNMFYEESGAFTGELSADMLTDAGVSHVILGHSERRQYFKEDDTMINKKIRKAIEHDIVPVICCGESLEQRESGVTLDFINGQIKRAFEQITSKQAETCIIAYEPIWAIGTGRVATTAQAQEVCKAIRNKIAQIYDNTVADKIRILYGGSVNAGNASQLFAQPDIDGGLVGGASLKAEFAEIVHYDRA